MVRIVEEEQQIEEGISTVLSPDIHFKGKLKFKSSLMIKGKLTGEISADGLLIVGPDAEVTAAVTAAKVVSYGKITGDINATRQVVMKQGAAQYGDITVPDLIIESGCIFDGKVSMTAVRPAIDERVQPV